MKLSELPVGKSAYLSLSDSQSPLITRFIDMGINAHSPIQCLFKSFMGGMRAYSIDENTVALRQDDAQHINIFCSEVL